MPIALSTNGSTIARLINSRIAPAISPERRVMERKVREKLGFSSILSRELDHSSGMEILQHASNHAQLSVIWMNSEWSQQRLSHLSLIISYNKHS
jgi:hypothetical protein